MTTGGTMSEQQATARRLVKDHGVSLAEEAGITLRDKPSPLWRLLVLSLLLSAPIGSEQAVSTARELSRSGWRTPARMRDSTWQQRVDALGAGGYRRFDESTSTRLADLAHMLLQRWDGDLRRLRADAPGDVRRLGSLLQEFDGIGPTGAAIFLREVQAVWHDVRPYADDLAREGAQDAGLPTNADGLATLVPASDVHRLVAACARVAREPGLLEG